MAIQRVILTDSRKEDVFYEEAIKTLRTNMQFKWCRDKEYCSHKTVIQNEGKK